jgi:hypothetical protein
MPEKRRWLKMAPGRVHRMWVEVAVQVISTDVGERYIWFEKTQVHLAGLLWPESSMPDPAIVSADPQGAWATSGIPPLLKRDLLRCVARTTRTSASEEKSDYLPA